MPLYMDRHNTPDVRAEDVAAAHLQDIKAQEEEHVRFLTYWFDSKAEKTFCLAEAPSRGAMERVHARAHGLIPAEIMEVNQGLVEDFLGKVENTAASETNFTEQNPPEESAFRTILFTDMVGSTAMTQHLGDRAAMELLRAHNDIIRDALTTHRGSEVKHTGDGIMASFVSATNAVDCSITIQRAFHERGQEKPERSIQVRIGVSAGEPVMEHEDLFGAAVQLGARICDHAEPNSILVANVVRELCIGKNFLFADIGEVVPKGFEEPVRLFEVRWQE